MREFLLLVAVGVGAVMLSRSVLAGAQGDDVMGDKSLPRGIRNHNPLNIEDTAKRDPWLGLDEPRNDGRYLRFQHPVYSYRAGAKVLASYRKRGITTLAGIIESWAPDLENNTAAYIASVSTRTGIGATEQVPLNVAAVSKLFQAMAIHECGAAWAGHDSLSIDNITSGVKMGLN